MSGAVVKTESTKPVPATSTSSTGFNSTATTDATTSKSSTTIQIPESKKDVQPIKAPKPLRMRRKELEHASMNERFCRRDYCFHHSNNGCYDFYSYGASLSKHNRSKYFLDDDEDTEPEPEPVPEQEPVNKTSETW